MRVYAQLPVNDRTKTAETARRAEAAGYDGVSTSELAHDLFMPLAIAASVTERVKLNTSIAVAFPRSPMITANIGHDLQTNSGGRFELGLGSQVKGHNERRFSVPWRVPSGGCASIWSPCARSGAVGKMARSSISPVNTTISP
jgi:alkanesulfonate monooxygenase SsuD/methylene tetrahydromethanopterin reductase-like flavin-dependent oxidoreductase (luciferase family)